MSKTKALLAAVLVLSAGVQARVVTVNSERLLAETKRGQELQKAFEADKQDLLGLQQRLQTEFAQKSQELQGRLDMLSPEARNKEIAALEMDKRRADRQLRETQEDMQFNAQQRRAEAHSILMLAARNLSMENNEDALLDSANPNFVLAFNPENDLTSEVVLRDNAQYDQEMAAAQAEQADESVTA